MKKNIYTQLKTIENGMTDLLSAMSSITNNNFSFRENKEDHWTPACDVYISKDKLYVIVELAGTKKESLELHTTDKSILVKGVRDFSLPCNDVCYYYMEIETGYFEREILFPEVMIDHENPTITLEKGLLNIIFDISEYEDAIVQITKD